MLVAPIAAGIAVSFLVARLLPHDRLGIPRLLWFIGLAGLSIATVRLTDRAVRRLIPLSSLLTLNLAFPDKAPNRFSVALRRPSARQLERDLAEAEANGVDSQSEWLVTLVQRLTEHDPRTRGHSERVRAYSVLIGEQMGLSDTELEKLHWAALLHDIGKLDVPSTLLNKPGRPSDAEWRVLQTHPGAGARYLAPLKPWLGEWTGAATEHHCRFDGSGYPESTEGRDISLAGRIVAVADAFDVMTSKRSYKEALSTEVALKELLRCAGDHFDPIAVRAMLEVGTDRLNKVAGSVSWLGYLVGVERSASVAVATEAGSTATTALTTSTATAALAGAQMAAAAIGVAALAPPVESEPDAVAFTEPVVAVEEVAASAAPEEPIDTGWQTPVTTTTVAAPSTTTEALIPVEARHFGESAHDAQSWVQAEAFDIGGAGVAYNVVDERTGDAVDFRPDDAVDIATRADARADSGPGLVVAGAQDGEWLEYTVTNLEPGDYVFQLRYSLAPDEPVTGILVFVDGTLAARVGALETTGDSGRFLQRAIPLTIRREGAEHVVRIFVGGSDPVDLDQWRFVRADPDGPKVRVYLDSTIARISSSMQTNGCVDFYGERGDPEVFNRTLCEDVARFPDLEPNMNDRIMSVAGQCGTVLTLYANTEFQGIPGESGRWNGQATIDFCQ